jgi:hypothetical protein
MGNILHRGSMKTLLADDLRGSFQYLVSVHLAFPTERSVESYNTIPWMSS